MISVMEEHCAFGGTGARRILAAINTAVSDARTSAGNDRLE
ncbi:MAG: hypothetical protein ACRCXD_18200 [Luteolibacter sp.]